MKGGSDMSLIICSECGKEFSDKAPACPNCGCPTEEIFNTIKNGLEDVLETENLHDVSMDFEYKKYHIVIKGENMKVYKKDELVADDSLSNYILLWSKTSALVGGQTEIVFFHPDMKNSLQILSAQRSSNYDTIMEFSAICDLYFTKDIQKSAFTAYGYNAARLKTPATSCNVVQEHNIPVTNTVHPSKNALCCPNCRGHNIDLWSDSANMKEFQRTGLNLNPLHPLTPFKTKSVKKEKKSAAKIGLGVMTGGTSLLLTGTKKKKHNEYYCRDCGNRWVGK